MKKFTSEQIYNFVANYFEEFDYQVSPQQALGPAFVKEFGLEPPVDELKVAGPNFIGALARMEDVDDNPRALQFIYQQFLAPKETIVGSAILFQGKVYTVLKPGRHNHCFAKIAEQNPDVEVMRGETQGFETSTGRFVDRVEAAKIAVESGQIPHTKWGDELYSEDVW